MDDPTERFVTGKGTYVGDLVLPEMLHLKIVRSRYGRARLLSVKGGIVAAEIRDAMSSVGEGAEGGAGSVPYPVLAKDRVNYVGQPIAAVLGRTPQEAEDLLDSVDVEYDPLKAVVDPEEALRAEPIHPGTSSNVMSRATVGQEFPDPDAAVVVEETLRNERLVPNPMEPRGVVVSWDGRKLTVHASTQSAISWHEGFQESLGLPKSAIRVVQMDTGGAFGTKGGIYPDYVVAARLAMRERRPVKWIETRSEHMAATDQGRGSRARMKVFADRTGKVLGLKEDLLVDGGAYPTGMASWSPGWIGRQATGPYAIPHAHVVGTAAFTNKVPLGPYRGAGRPEAAFFIDRMMDFLADELRMDPVDVRLRNASDKPFTSPTGLRVPPFRAFLEDAVRELDARKASAARNQGFSSFILVPAASDGEAGRIRVEDGRVRVWLGGNPHGQGHEVFVRELVAKELGVPEDVIDLEKSDTDALGKGVGSWGSRSAMVGGGAAIQAGRKVKEAVMRKRGEYSAKELLKGSYEAEVFFKPEGNYNSFGANLVTADVEETGFVKVREVAAFYDAGQILNPAMFESQVVGGSVQGIGQVLTEGAFYDADGQVLVGTIGDAGVLSSMEIPRFRVKTAATRSDLPHGAKGVGESPTIGVPPALVRAIERQVGRRLTHTPLHPAELLEDPRA